MTARVTTSDRRWRPPIPDDRRRAVVGGATGLTALALVTRFLLTVLSNAPTGPMVGGARLVAVGTTALAGIAAIGLALTESEPVAGVGLLFVGVFGLLSTVSGSVTVSAAVAVVAGTAAVALGYRDRLATVRGAAIGALVVALAVNLVGGVGGWVTLRPLGSTLALAAVAVTPVFAAPNARSALGGGVVAVAVVALGLAVPFVVGAVTLASGGVVGASLPVVALATGGAVMAGSAAVRRREWSLLTAVVLVTAAGIPATLPRAVPFALGVTTLAIREGRR